jgi:hypothetical protein
MDPRIRINPKMSWIRNPGFSGINHGFVSVPKPYGIAFFTIFILIPFVQVHREQNKAKRMLEERLKISTLEERLKVPIVWTLVTNGRGQRYIEINDPFPAVFFGPPGSGSTSQRCGS